MAILGQIIKFAAIANLRVADCAAINTAVGAQLHIIANHYRPKRMNAGKGLRFGAFERGSGGAPVSAGPVGRAAARGCEGAQRCEHDCQSRTPCAECEVTVVILGLGVRPPAIDRPEAFVFSS